MEKSQPKKPWKQRLLHEVTEYWINFIYMTVFFSAIIFYRRMVLAEYGIHLDDYFMGVIKALVIAKVVMIGAFMSISRKFENRPLIIPVVYKAVIFTVLVLLFDLFEKLIRAVIENPQMAEVMQALHRHASADWLASGVLIFVSFIPFFAFKEMVRVMGSEKMRTLFFGERSKAS